MYIYIIAMFSGSHVCEFVLVLLADKATLLRRHTLDLAETKV